jgi:hypothetical protein
MMSVLHRARPTQKEATLWLAALKAVGKRLPGAE